MKYLIFILLGCLPSAHAIVLPHVIKLPFETNYVSSPLLLSPDGTFVIVQAAAKIVYVDLNQNTAKILPLPVYERMWVTSDSRHIYGIHPDKKQIDYVELDSSGTVSSVFVVWKESPKRTFLTWGEVLLSKNNRLFFEEYNGSKMALRSFDPKRKIADTVFYDPTVVLMNPKSYLFANHPYAMQNDFILVYKAPCPSHVNCRTGGVYAVSVDDLAVRDLGVPDDTSDGRLTDFGFDGRSNSPWGMVLRCFGPNGQVGSIVNIHTKEERKVFLSPEIDYCSTAGGMRAYMTQGDKAIFSEMQLINSGRVIRTQVYDFSSGLVDDLALVGLMDSAETGLIKKSETEFAFYEFKTKKESPAINLPAGRPIFLFQNDRSDLNPGHHNFIPWVFTDSGFAWAAEYVDGQGDHRDIPVWKIKLGQPMNPNADMVIQSDSYYVDALPCLHDPLRHQLLCTTLTGKSDLNIWRL